MGAIQLTKLVFCSFVLGLAVPCSSQVLINEVMYNPSGNENYNEYIELYNAGDQPADISGYSISDSSSSDKIIETGSGTILHPGQYCIVIDPEYFSNSSLYDTLINDNCLVLTIDGSTFGSRGLSNSKSEPVMLISSSGDVISRYTYIPGLPDGYSIEKWDPNSSDESDWKISKVFLGTPGLRNSITPPDRDVMIDSIYVEPAFPVFGEVSSIGMKIVNVGLNPVSGGSITVYTDLDKNDIADRGEILYSSDINTSYLSVYGDTYIHKFTWQPDKAGTKNLSVNLTWIDDEDENNNIRKFRIIILDRENHMIINEIMYNPATGCPEWIEIYNMGDNPANLSNWIVGDLANPEKGLITTGDTILLPGSFTVLSSDKNGVSSFYPHHVNIVQVNGFPTLNNTGDTISLKDPSGRISDSVPYMRKWGNKKGVSLERISYTGQSSSMQNWGLSTNPSGATPGITNSILYNENNTDPVVVIENSPFSPDKGESAKINLTLPFEISDLTVKVFDRHGRLIRNIISGQRSGSQCSIEWDGCNDNGNLMGTGIYIILLRAVSTVSQKRINKKLTVVLVRQD